MEAVFNSFYTYAIGFMVLMVVLWIVETIYLRKTKHDDHPSRYVNEIFYEEITKDTDK